MPAESTFWPTMLVGLRGAVMLAGGLFALFAPRLALATLVWVGGLIVIFDGVLGIWALVSGGRQSPRFGVAITRNLLAILIGVLVVLFPSLAGAVGISTLVVLVGVLLVVVGALALYVTVAGRDMLRKGTFWPEVLSACAYLIFGVLLLMVPLTSAMVLVQIVGALMVLYGLFQLYIAWQMRGLTVSV